MKKQEQIAEKIFSRFGLKFSDAKRAGGWTNAVWLNGDIALRVSYLEDSDRIRREVALAEHLPKAVGYPQNINIGVTDGCEWSASKRITGDNLSVVWDNLDWNKRLVAVKQILSMVHELHTVDISKVESLSNNMAWYSSFDVNETCTSLERYKDKKIFTAKQIDALYNRLELFWESRKLAKHVLNHGDITMDNLMWCNGDIVSLMDFEHSVIAPPELDLHSIVNLTLLSNEGNCDTTEYSLYKDNVIKLFEPMLNHSSNEYLILGYAILFRMRFIDMWFENPHCKLNDLKPYIELNSIVGGAQGFLSEIISV